MRRLAALLLLTCAAELHAKPEILARYMADPFAKAANCLTCHHRAQGGGPRKPFGVAFQRVRFVITPEFRAQWPDYFQQEKTAQADNIKVVWPASKDEQALLQIGGDTYVMDRAEGKLTKVTTEQAAAFVKPAAAPAAPSPAPELAPEERTLPTFDYYLVNLATTRARPAKSLHLRFTHRFDDPLVGKTGALRDLFGLDSSSSVSSFGVEVGIKKWLSFVTYRMPTRGDQTIELGPQLNILEQGGRSPVSLTFKATVEGQKNFTERFTTNLQPAVSRAFGTWVELFVVPTFSIAVPRRTLTFDFPITPGERRDNQAAIGTGISIRVRPSVAIVGEWIPRVAGFRGLGTSHTYSLGIQRKTSRHSFGLTVSNNSFSTTSRMVSDGRGDLRIGFNLYRRIW